MYKIKVQDFAYENTLPPIRPIFIFCQIQPKSGSMQHPQKHAGNDGGNLTTPRAGLYNEGDPRRTVGLERKLTEPNIPSTNTAELPLLTREFAVVDLGGHSAQQFSVEHTTKIQKACTFIYFIFQLSF
jgi:hypothetical protein